ncbi:MAG: DedA family protein [Magnetococcales bacterium]|nr:DedA family protein [Magnetococcales bacterium]
MSLFLAYGGLWAGAFLAATLLPFSSEAMLAAMLYSGEYTPFYLWLAATTGNVAGSLVNWWLGRYCLRWQGRRWFPFPEEGLARSRRWFMKFGVWSLLLAWLPLVGDPITFLGGVFRVPLPLFTGLVLIGKGVRYFLLLQILPL